MRVLKHLKAIIQTSKIVNRCSLLPRIIKKANLYNGNEENILKAIDENNQLISIFVASIKTSKSNNSNIKNR